MLNFTRQFVILSAIVAKSVQIYNIFLEFPNIYCKFVRFYEK